MSLLRRAAEVLKPDRGGGGELAQAQATVQHHQKRAARQARALRALEDQREREEIEAQEDRERAAADAETELLIAYLRLQRGLG